MRFTDGTTRLISTLKKRGGKRLRKIMTIKGLMKKSRK
jgi:hypothetical protein